MPVESIVKTLSPEDDSNINVNVSLHSRRVSSYTVRLTFIWADESRGNSTLCASWGISVAKNNTKKLLILNQIEQL